jgi:hypothetical protein
MTAGKRPHAAGETHAAVPFSLPAASTQQQTRTAAPRSTLRGSQAEAPSLWTPGRTRRATTDRGDRATSDCREKQASGDTHPHPAARLAALQPFAWRAANRDARRAIAGCMRAHWQGRGHTAARRNTPVTRRSPPAERHRLRAPAAVSAEGAGTHPQHLAVRSSMGPLSGIARQPRLAHPLASAKSQTKRGRDFGELAKTRQPGSYSIKVT